MKIHWWALLLPLYLLPVTMNHSNDFESAIYRAFYYSFLLTFLALMPHEFGHAFASRYFGVRRAILHIAGIVGGWKSDENDWKQLQGWHVNRHAKMTHFRG